MFSSRPEASIPAWFFRNSEYPSEYSASSLSASLIRGLSSSWHFLRLSLRSTAFFISSFRASRRAILLFVFSRSFLIFMIFSSEYLRSTSSAFMLSIPSLALFRFSRISFNSAYLSPAAFSAASSSLLISSRASYASRPLSIRAASFFSSSIAVFSSFASCSSNSAVFIPSSSEPVFILASARAFTLSLYLLITAILAFAPARTSSVSLSASSVSFILSSLYLISDPSVSMISVTLVSGVNLSSSSLICSA